MKNLLVVIDVKNQIDLQNILNAARGGKGSPKEVKTFAGRALLLDIHNYPEYFSRIVSGAESRNLNVFVFSLDDAAPAPMGTENSMTGNDTGDRLP